MSFIHRFHLLGLFAGLFILAEGGRCYLAWSGAGAARLFLEVRQREMQALHQLSPAPTQAAASALASDLGKAEGVLAERRQALHGQMKAAVTGDSSQVDASFAVVDFMERAAERAKKAGTILKPGERFGFASYFRTGAGEDSVRTLFRRLDVADYLIRALFEARPAKLLELQRERPAHGEERSNGDGGMAGDYFEPDPRLLARVPGIIETAVFRVVFVGETATLREFLNQLSGEDSPLFVCLVEAEAAVATGGVESRAKHPDETLPLIAPAPLKFTVVLETAEPVSPEEAST